MAHEPSGAYADSSASARIYDNPSTLVVPTGAPSSQRISWAAVFAGVVIALVVHLMLTMFGTGIGFSTVDPMQYDTPSVKALSFGAGLWWVVSSLLSLYAGGWTAGRLAGVPREKDSMLHGVLTWGVTTLVSAYLVTSLVGSLFAATGNVVKGVAGGASQMVSAVAPGLANKAQDELQQRGINLDSLKSEALKTLRQTGKPALQPEAMQDRAEGAADQAQASAETAARNPQAADDEFSLLFDKLFKEGQEVASQADRDALANVVAARTGMSKAEATATVAKWEQQYQQAKAKLAEQAEKLKAQAREAADKAASALAKTALWGFFALALGGLAAAFGARMGRPARTITT